MKLNRSVLVVAAMMIGGAATMGCKSNDATPDTSAAAGDSTTDTPPDDTATAAPPAPEAESPGPAPSPTETWVQGTWKSRRRQVHLDQGPLGGGRAGHTYQQPTLGAGERQMAAPPRPLGRRRRCPPRGAPGTPRRAAPRRAAPRRAPRRDAPGRAAQVRSLAGG